MENDEKKKEKPKLRIHVFIGILMVGVALIYDGSQNLVDLLSFGLLGWIINPLISFWSFLTFFTWFSLFGVSYAKPGKAMTVGVSYLIEVIPLLSNIPTITLSVIILLAMTYSEDLVAKLSPQAAAALSKALSGSKLGKARSVAT